MNTPSSDQDLIDFSGDHLRHELEMFWWLSRALWYMDGHMHDALLESFLVHLRNLTNFFCRDRYGDDVVASDFFDNPSTWTQQEPVTLRDARIRADKELSHITRKRKNLRDTGRDWDVERLFGEIEGLAKRFAATASARKLHSEIKKLANLPTGQLLTVGGASASTNSTSRAVIFSTGWSPFDR